MANIKPLLEHVARGIWSMSPGFGDWDEAPGPLKASCLAQATQLLANAPVLYDALRDDALRELLSYCTARGDSSEATYYESFYGCPAYRDVAEKLAKILDGES